MTSLHSSTKYHRRHLAYAAIFVLSLFIPTNAQRPNGNRTLEQCRKDDDCGIPLKCYDRNIQKCPDDAPRCICLNKFGNVDLCNKSEDCPRREACAINPRTGVPTCTGCLLVTDTSLNFSQVDPQSSKCVSSPTPIPSPSPKSKAAPGLSFDLCSVDLPCADAYKCTHLKTGKECRSTDILCDCRKDVEVACKSSDDCPNGETCALHIFSLRKLCSSCSAEENDPFIVADSSSSSKAACSNQPPRPFPTYISSPNGLSADRCTQDAMCVPPNVCRDVRFNLCNLAKSSFCVCGQSTSVVCERAADCMLGEYCVQGSDEQPSFCLSKAAFEESEAGKFTVLYKRKAATSTGVTLDTCMFDWDCAPSRRCTHRDDAFGGCAGRQACVCLPMRRRPCMTDGDCAPAEQCANYAGGRSATHCVSRAVVSKIVDFVPAEEATSATPVPLRNGSRGFTDDRCTKASDCVSSGDVDNPRVCRHFLERGGECNGRAACYCKRDEDVICGGEAGGGGVQCVKGEICVRVKDSVLPARCVSRRAVRNDPDESFEKVAVVLPSETPDLLSGDVGNRESSAGDDGGAVESPTYDSDIISSHEGEATTLPSDDSNANGDETVNDLVEDGDETVCIDANALRHVSDSDLVFPSARRAAVLCDGDKNCATRGHIVVWKGRAMMMGTYCEREDVTCVRRVMDVNSPRMRPGLRVTSRTDGFEFTAFAARYETNVEEHVLTRLVHIGL